MPERAISEVWICKFDNATLLANSPFGVRIFSHCFHPFRLLFIALTFPVIFGVLASRCWAVSVRTSPQQTLWQRLWTISYRNAHHTLTPQVVWSLIFVFQCQLIDERFLFPIAEEQLTAVNLTLSWIIEYCGLNNAHKLCKCLGRIKHFFSKSRDSQCIQMEMESICSVWPLYLQSFPACCRTQTAKHFSCCRTKKNSPHSKYYFSKHTLS